MARQVRSVWLCILGLLASAASAAHAQQVVAADFKPHFVADWKPSKTEEVEVRKAPVLVRRLALELTDAPLSVALDEVVRQGDLELSYNRAALPQTKTVTLHARDIPVAAALTAVLLGSGLDVAVSRDGRLGLIPCRHLVTAAAKDSGAIAGRVTDKKTGIVLAGATVVVDGTRHNATTGSDGRYRIVAVAPGTYTVRARYIGYAPGTASATVSADQEATADFVLTPAPTRLEEIVTTATGLEPRFRVGNAIGSINADSVVRDAPVTNLNELLAGRVPGVQVNFDGGNTGQASPIRIRGMNSFGVSNDPIFIVDGARVDASTGSDRFTSPTAGFGQSGGRLSDLNPSEIETIDIVKGPSAATLYGTDAANGVVVITTKRGRPGPARWTFIGEGGTLHVADHYNTPLYWAYGTNLRTGASMHCVLVQVAQGACRQDSVAVWNPLEDPQTSPFGTGHRWVAGAQVAGGADRFSYFLSANQEQETGYLRMPASEVQRLTTLRAVASLPDYELRPNALKKTSIRTNVGTSLGRVADLQLSSGLVFNDTRIPSVAAYRNGAFAFGPPTPTGGGFYGSVGDVLSVKNQEQTTRFTSSLVGSYHPRDWFHARGTVGVDHSSGFTDALALAGEDPAQFPTGGRQNARSGITLWSADFNVGTQLPLGHDLTARTTIGGQYNRRDGRTTVVSANGLPPGSQTVAGATAVTGTESTVQTVVAGGFLEQAFAWRERLFVTGALRLDGAGSFGRNFSTAVYPKASVSWLVWDGARGAHLPGVSNLRLRAAYGTSGVQPGAVDALAQEQLSQALVGGQVVSGATMSAIGNPDLKPERQTEIETGLDAQFFGGRISLELTAYSRQSHDAIVPLQLPPSLGNNMVALQNLGEVRNRGLEGTLAARVLDSRMLSLDLSLTGNVNENRLLSTGGTPPGSPFDGNQVGYPIFSRFDYPIIDFADRNGDGIITPDEVHVDRSKTQSHGPLRPQRSLTHIATIGLFEGKLRASAMFDYQGGFTITNYTDVTNCAFGTCRAVNDPKAPIADQAAAQAFLGTFSLWGFNQDGSFIRFRELSVNYQLPDRWARALGARSASVAIAGRNLALFASNYSGFSPEANSSPGAGFGDNSGSTGAPAAPPARYWLLRFNLGF